MWLHRCHRRTCCPQPADGGVAGAAPRAARPFTIDLHCHAFSPEVEALVASTPQKRAEPELMLQAMGADSVAHNNSVMLPQAARKMRKLEQRLADMDAMGVDVQVISPSPNQYYHWAERELAIKLVNAQNEAIASQCRAHPQRIAGLGTVALQHPELACEQLEHAVRTLGLKGIEISTSVNGRELSDPSLRAVWHTAEALGAVVFIHPFGTTLGERTRSWYLVNTVGQPLETTIALSHLIFGGVLEDHPRLKIVAAHGGGYLPTCVGRSDRAYAVRPEAGVWLKHMPSELLQRIWYDTVVHDSVALRHLVERVGASQVVVGTDYPFDMGGCDVHRLIADTTGLTPDDRRNVLGGNAARLIGWQLDAQARKV